MAHFIHREAYFGESRMPLHVSWANVRNRVPPHYHDFGELVLVASGTGRHVTASETYPMLPGDVFVISEGNVHGYEDVDGLQVINVLYDFAALGLSLDDLAELPGYHPLFTLEPNIRHPYPRKRHLSLSPERMRGAVELVTKVEQVITEGRPGYRFAATTAFRELILYLTQAVPTATGNHPNLLRLGQLLSHLETHYREPITLHDLCRQAHMSESTLLRHFHRTVGCTPIDYLARIRIRHAARALTQSSRAIGDIALDHGYSSSNYFARQFKQLMGQTPRQYRRQSHPARG